MGDFYQSPYFPILKLKMLKKIRSFDGSLNAQGIDIITCFCSKEFSAHVPTTNNDYDAMLKRFDAFLDGIQYGLSHKKQDLNITI